jgi:hypothetical protein
MSLPRKATTRKIDTEAQDAAAILTRRRSLSRAARPAALQRGLILFQVCWE